MLKSDKRKIFFLSLFWLVPLVVYYVIQPFLKYGMPDGDVYLYHRLGFQLMNGEAPFIDYFFEYPPASVLVFLLPTFVTTAAREFVVVYQLISWSLLWAINMLILKLHSFLEIKSVSKPRLFLYSSIISFILMVLAINRFDTFSAFFSLLGLVFFVMGVQTKTIRYRTFGVIFVLFAALIKLYPIFLLPFFGLYEIKNLKFKAMTAHAVTSLLFLAPFAWWLAKGYQGLKYFLSYHSTRHLEIESLWTTMIMFGHQAFGLFEYKVVYEYGSIGIRGDLADILSNLSLVIFVAILSLAMLLFFAKLTTENTTELLLKAYIISMLGFAAVNKVFSAQYMVWFMPVLLIELGLELEKKRLLRIDRLSPWQLSFIFCVAMCLATVIVFPMAWGLFTEGNIWLTGILLLRNILLAFILLNTLKTMVPNRKELIITLSKFKILGYTNVLK